MDIIIADKVDTMWCNGSFTRGLVQMKDPLSDTNVFFNDVRVSF